MAPVFGAVKFCDCCGGEHSDVRLFAPGIPEHVKVWHDLPRDGGNLWYLCPVFGYAVLCTFTKLPSKNERGA